MVRTLRYGSDNRIDGSRILGYAAAIALHALALMLLLIPMTAPQGRPASRCRAACWGYCVISPRIFMAFSPPTPRRWRLAPTRPAGTA